MPTTVFWPKHGFYSRFGSKLEDWEPVSGPEDYGLDEYELQVKKKHLKLR